MSINYLLLYFKNTFETTQNKYFSQELGSAGYLPGWEP